MSEHPVIYLAPSDDPEREWCQDDVWESSVRYNLGADFDRVTAERDAALASLDSADASTQTLHEVITRLQQRLTAADERVDVLQQRQIELQRQLGERWSEISAYQDTVEKQSERADVLEGLLREASVQLHDFITAPLLDRIDAALKPAECCTVSAEDRALLEAGDYTPEELFGVGGKPSCPKCAP